MKALPAESVRLLRELAKHGHASAQAFLADMYWRGNHVPKDPVQAYLLITLAIDNAPSAERIWIEDSYQHIFCGAGEGVRKQAQGSVADWRDQYGPRRRQEQVKEGGLADFQPRAARTCSNGVVVPLRHGEAAVEPGPSPSDGDLQRLCGGSDARRVRRKLDERDRRIWPPRCRCNDPGPSALSAPEDLLKWRGRPRQVRGPRVSPSCA